MDYRNIQELSNEIRQSVIDTQDELDNTVYYGKSKDSKVKVYVKGNCEIDDVKIDSTLLNIDSKELLESNIIEAVTYAMQSSRLDQQARLFELMKKFNFKGL